MEIGSRIKQRREYLRMSQEELAHKVGYKSRSSINKIESDGRGLPQNKIVAFAKALETTPAYLMGWDKDNDNSDDSFAFYGFSDILSAYIQELGEFLYCNPNHKVLIDSIMEVKAKDIELAKQMLDRINGKYSDNVVSIEDARTEYLDADAAHELPNASTEDKLHDEDIMNDDNF